MRDHRALALVVDADDLAHGRHRARHRDGAEQLDGLLAVHEHGRVERADVAQRAAAADAEHHAMVGSTCWGVSAVFSVVNSSSANGSTARSRRPGRRAARPSSVHVCSPGSPLEPTASGLMGMVDPQFFWSRPDMSALGRACGHELLDQRARSRVGIERGLDGGPAVPALADRQRPAADVEDRGR